MTNNLAAESKKPKSLKHNINPVNHYRSLINSFLFLYIKTPYVLQTRENYDHYGSNTIPYKQTINRLLFLEQRVS